MLMGTNGSFSFCFHFRLFSWCAHKLNLFFVRGRIGAEIQAKMNIIFRPWPDRRRLGEEKKQISPYRRGMRFLMLMRYRGGQPPSHHTVVTSDVRNSFLPEMPKVHAIWHLSVYFLGRLLTTILVVSATPKKTSVPSRAWKKDRVFSLTKTVFFAFNFEAFPECNPIFGDLRQETFMAARLKPNLRMAESTLR